MSEFKAWMPTPALMVDDLLDKGFCVECIKGKVLEEGFSSVNLDEVDVVARRAGAEGRCTGCAKDRAIVLHASEQAKALLRQPPDY